MNEVADSLKCTLPQPLYAPQLVTRIASKYAFLRLKDYKKEQDHLEWLGSEGVS